MKKALSLLCFVIFLAGGELLAANLQPIGSPIPSETLCGRTLYYPYKNPANGNPLIQLHCEHTSSASASCTARQTGTSAGYTPSGSNKFRIFCVRYGSNTGTAAGLAVGYGDNDVGLNSTTAITNPKDTFGQSALYQLPKNPGTGSASGFMEARVNILIINGKFVEVTSNGSTGSMDTELFGWEEP